MSRPIRFMDATYEKVEDGYSVPEPVLHVFGRDSYYNRRHVRVDGFHPYFCVTLEEALEHSEDLSNDHRVRCVETETADGEHIESLRGVRLAKVVTVMPYHVKDLREQFRETWEADVLFPDRFTYDVGITDSFRVTDESYEDGDVVSVENIEPTDDVDVPPRLLYLDIEVQQSEDGPSVVSETGRERAQDPITAITTYDSYADEYVAHVLAHDSWTHAQSKRASEVRTDDSSIDVSVNVYESEWHLLSSFADDVSEYRADVLTSWNAPFDFPYLVNRYFTLDHMDVFQLSDTRSVESMDGSGRFMNGDIEGPILLDLLTAYEKATVTELDSSSLEDVSASVGEQQKLDISDEVEYSKDDPYTSGIDKAWEEYPETFVRYSIRDVEAMVEINENMGLI